jgi:hypothetical protein
MVFTVISSSSEDDDGVGTFQEITMRGGMVKPFQLLTPSPDMR